MFGEEAGWREVRAGPWNLVEGKKRPDALISQGWKNGTWRHDLAVWRHPDPVAEDTCLIEITGDDSGMADDMVSQGLGSAARLPVVTLFNVPNQPTYDLREDALLAYSFLQAVSTGDRAWAVLVPMVVAVLAAMDAATELSDGQWTRFVLTGASKRGWTTWLAAATGDPRVVGAAPRVFDNLRAADQMRKQVADWDGYSPMLEDYTALGLQEMAADGPAAGLAGWLDPVTYAGDIAVPLLLVNGANDPFWCTDASSVYVGDLPATASFAVCPNVRHVGALPGFAAGAFAALCSSAASGTPWPAPRPRWDGDAWHVDSPTPFGRRVWAAHAADGRFENARWFVSDDRRPPRHPGCRTAHFVELMMPGVGSVGPYSLTSHVVVSPPVS